MAPRIHSLAIVPPEEPEESLGPASFSVPNSTPGAPQVEDGTIHIEHPDGSVDINLNPDMSTITGEDDESDFYANLAKKMDQGELDTIASQLLDGIKRDEDSRKEWMTTRSRGIALLGLVLEEPRGDVGTSSAPLEGMSTVRHPLLLEATIGFQATARGELLPATGPVKIRNDTVSKPAQAGGQAVGSPLPAQPGGGGALPSPVAAAPPPDSIAAMDELAAALETDMNHYLTVTATEYVPDTDRMLFYIGFGGDGFKKVYNCPLRDRPVSESVDAEDLIISNSATDLQNCGRVTHRSKMRKSVLRRMQLVDGGYRDVELHPPSSVNETNPVEQKKEELSGQKLTMLDPEDRDYTIYEVHCELELDQFAPRKFKGKGLPLPYRVTIEKDSRQVLSVIRRWDEDDDECLPKQFFVQFPFIRGLGFYGLGFIHVLGNTTSTLTACWREMVDAGMFANFPAFIYDKGAGRQLTNQFRASPGQGIPMQPGPNQSVKDSVFPMPYKDIGSAFSSFVDKVDERGRKLAGTADIAIGEGKQEAPVGTTLALIEQATKMLDSVHKRLHWAQSEEFKLLKDRFKENPEAFWRNNKRPAFQWRKEQFLQALDNCDLVPVADPNNPTSLHRLAKGVAIEGMAAKYPQIIDTVAALKRVFRIGGIDSEGLFRDQPLPPPPDPRMEAIQAKSQQQAAQLQYQESDSLRRMQVQVAQLIDKSHDRESRERLETMKVQIEHMRTQQEGIVHAHEMRNATAESMEKIRADRAQKISDLANERAKMVQQIRAEQMKAASGIQAERIKTVGKFQNDMIQNRLDAHASARESAIDEAATVRVHNQKMEHERQVHEQRKRHQDEMHAAKLAHEKALAKVRKTATPKKT